MAEETKTKEVAPKAAKKLAVIRIRGAPKMKGVVEDTLKMLHLPKRNSCSVLPDNPSFRGMIKKVNSYVTWGEASEETIKIFESKKFSCGLKPAKQGLERKGIKMPFNRGGVLGYRGKDINKLIERMS